MQAPEQPAFGSRSAATGNPSPLKALRRVAIADSDTGFVRVLENRLTAAGWEPRALGPRAEAAELQRARASCLVIDPSACADDPWALLEELSAVGRSLAIVVCTTATTVAERVRGLRLGADDWVTKPCHPEEVVARLEAVVRRLHTSETTPAAVRAGELEVRPEMYDAFVGGHAVGLTRREFELLQAFVQATGTVIPRDELYERVWGYTMAHGDRSVDVFVRRLRTKLAGPSPRWAYVHTHFGIGYRFQPEPTEQPGDDATSS